MNIFNSFVYVKHFDAQNLKKKERKKNAVYKLKQVKRISMFKTRARKPLIEKMKPKFAFKHC